MLLAMSHDLDAIDLDALPGDVRTLIVSLHKANSDLKASNADLEVRNADLAARVERLDYLNTELNRLVYGKRSERLSPDERQLAFEDLETAVAESEAAGAHESGARQTATEPRPARKPRKRNIGALPEHLPRIEEVIEPASTACPCGCGEMVKIGEDRSERLDIIPAQFRVIVTVRPKYACSTCRTGVHQAPAKAWLIENALPTEALLAHVIVWKFCNHVPLYRQSGIHARDGIDIDRSTLADWVGKGGFHLTPIVEAMADEIKRGDHLFMDETRIPVLDPGRGRTKTGYFWALARDERGHGGAGPPAVVYFYAASRAGAHAARFLKGFGGTLTVDGYAGYHQLTNPSRPSDDGGPLTLAHCWAHSRRKLKEIYDKDGSPIAKQGLDLIAKLYRIETDIRGEPPDTRKQTRADKSKLLTGEIRAWLDRSRRRVSGKSRLGEALAYIDRLWPGLVLFLDDGRVELDTNPVENRIRPQVLTRKNALFAGHDTGAETWAKIASLIETCRLNDVDPQAYLEWTFKKIANAHPKAKIKDLFPWTYKKLSTENPDGA